LKVASAPSHGDVKKTGRLGLDSRPGCPFYGLARQLLLDNQQYLCKTCMILCKMGVLTVPRHVGAQSLAPTEPFADGSRVGRAATTPVRATAAQGGALLLNEPFEVEKLVQRLTPSLSGACCAAESSHENRDKSQQENHQTTGCRNHQRDDVHDAFERVDRGGVRAFRWVGHGVSLVLAE
jgi:hypothetical protein